MIELLLAFMLSIWSGSGTTYHPFGEGGGTPPSDTTSIGGETGHTPPILP